MTITHTDRDRVEAVIEDCFDHDYEPTAWDVASALCDEDASAGEYEGCSTELELAHTTYERIASEMLS